MMKPVACNGYSLLVADEVNHRDFIRFCCQADLLNHSACKQVTSSKFAAVVRFDFRGQRYFHKTFLSRGKAERLKGWFRGSRAMRSLRGHQLLIENEFHAPEVVLVGEKQSLNFAVTRAIERTGGFCATTFGETIGRMHALNIKHGDLSLGNILLCGEKIVFIDNESTKRRRTFFARERLRNLQQLNFSAQSIRNTDKMRFFNAYLTRAPTLKNNKKVWIKRILEKTAQRTTHQKKPFMRKLCGFGSA